MMMAECILASTQMLALLCFAMMTSSAAMPLKYSFSLPPSAGRGAARPAFWVGKNGDVLRSGSTSAVAPSKLEAGPNWTWTEPVGGLLRASPVLDSDRNIFVSTVSGSIYKFSVSGAELWRHTAGRVLPVNPVLSNNTIFTVAVDCTVLALDAFSGEEIWRRKAGEGSGVDTASVLAGEGVVVAPCFGAGEEGKYGGNTYIVALDAEDGRLLWTYRPSAAVYNFIGSIDQGSLVLSDEFGSAKRLDLRTAKTLWEVPAPKGSKKLSTGGAIVGPDKHVYVTSNIQDASGVERGVLTSYRFEDGSLLWQKVLPYAANSGPAIGHLGLSALSVVLAIGPNPSLPLPGGATLDVDPLLPDFSDGQRKPGRVYAFDAAAGAQQWAFDLPDWHGPAAGDRADHVCLPDSFANPAIGGDGTAYIVGESGRAYSIQDKNADGKISPEAGEASYLDIKNGFQGAPAIGPGILALAACDGLRVFLAGQ
eukprot:CAMPEP_0197644708 /NCGR_PEP_ID=MMETSP1338-20131121/17589_1 /TAXON_ID=43686 ORGANISM="Pelagodinium beii, Strain RCC1491" /NCGR_SAMPLE_ID=MMETSP1338 /ASSEMBLY_ACC=CAM_ASM_000754 /LENGTH=478 /DNA_ID=CAMNT_0043218145 /DNA_START=51 /DNA_END=1487 /DNA_ORIENTATION=+